MRLMMNPRTPRSFKPLAIFSVLCLAHAPLSAQELPDGIKFTPAFGTTGDNIFTNPAMMVEMPGKPGYFVVPEMGNGKLWLLAPGASGYTKTQFGTVAVNAGEMDMGLTGLAFHPKYAENGKYYVKHGLPTRPPRQNALDERIATADRLKDSGAQPRRLLTIDEPNEFNDHNGGSPVFGPDGFLYLGLGDGGWDLTTPDLYKNGQNLKSLLGKIIRIDVDTKSPGLEYGIPPSNPFAANLDPAVRKEIWAYGLRNPYRLSFDRVTDELYAGDIGWIKFDEVDIIKKGGNYGWSVKEGSYCLPDGGCAGVTAQIEEPALYMQNGDGPNMLKCVIGGVVYRGDPASPFYGGYIFGDYTLPRVYGFRKSSAGAVRTAKDYGRIPMPPIAFTLDSQNNIYMIGLLGSIYKLDHAQLKSMPTVAVRASASGARAPGFRAAFASQGRLNLPVGLAGTFEAYTPAGARLGLVAAGGNAQGTLPASADGLVLLRAIQSP
jgi:glucose/arabinose dehydrogenase